MYCKGSAFKHYLGQGDKGAYVVVLFKLVINDQIKEASWFGSLNPTVNAGKKKSGADVTFETLIGLGFKGNSLQDLNTGDFAMTPDLVVDLAYEQDEKGRYKVTGVRTGSDYKPVDTNSIDTLWKAKFDEAFKNKVAF